MENTMTIFDDYRAWKKENYNLISTLVKNKSNTISRFTAVIAVVDYLNDEINKRALNEDEELIFSTGFDYIFDQFHLINTLLEMRFNNDIKEMEKYAQTINLLLYVNEFQSELLSQEDDIKKNISLLDDLEDKINTCLDNKKNVPEEYFMLLDQITYEIFELNNIEINTVDQIFYEIAIEYQIFVDDEYDVYNHVINEQIRNNRD